MRRVIMIAAVAGLLIWPAGTASAAAGSQTVWKVQATPNPAGVLGSQLTGVSCPSAKACFAVGASSTGDQGNQPLAEHWNGTVWAIQHAVKPKTSEDTDLEAISCPTVSNCTAVGFYTNTSGSNLALAEHWNGSAWSVQRIPTPSSVLAGNPFKLLGVSCAAAHSCVTVGFYFDPSLDGNVIVAEHWNGKRWAIQNIVTPPGSASTFMQGVSCSAAASCTAVGSYTNASGLGATLAEVWNGASWAIQDTPSPAGATEGSTLIGVSCPSPADCTAAGYSTDGSGNTTTLAEQWNGSAWAIQSTPNESSGAPVHNDLWGVSCAAADSCSATGYFTNSSVLLRPLAEHWNGTSWVVEDAPDPSGRNGSSLQGGVSCSSPSKCTAVGWSQNKSGTSFTLAERR